MKLERFANQKYCSIRYCLLFCLSFLLGILVYYKSMQIGRVLILVSFILYIVAISVFIATKKHKWAILFGVLLIAFSMGLVRTMFECNEITKRQINEENIVIEGEICDSVELTYGKKCNMYLKNVTLYDTENGSQKLKGKLFLTVFLGEFDVDNIEVGDKLRVESRIYDIQVFQDEVNMYYYKNNVYWRGENSRIIDLVKGEMPFREKIIEYIKTTIKSNMSQDNYGISLAMLIGDTSQMNEDLSETYRVNGLLHVFSVSGLHISFLVSVMLSFTSQRKSIISTIIIIGVLVFYSSICGFPVSVIRAMIMAICMLISNMFANRYDMLTSLCCSFILVLLINPLYIFDGGFLMSYSSVFGMATVGKYYLSQYKRKHKYSKGFKKSLILSIIFSVSAVLGSLVFVISFIEEFSIIGILINILSVEVLSAVFILIFVGCFPFMNGLLKLSDVILTSLNTAYEYSAKIPYASVSINDLKIGAVFVFVLIIVLAGLINMSHKTRKKVVAVTVSLCLVFSVIANMPKEADSGVYVYAGYNEDTLFFVGNNEVIMLSSFSNSSGIYALEEFLKHNKINKLSLIITGNDINDTILNKFIETFKSESFNYVIHTENLSVNEEKILSESFQKVNLLSGKLYIDNYVIENIRFSENNENDNNCDFLSLSKDEKAFIYAFSNDIKKVEEFVEKQNKNVFAVYSTQYEDKYFSITDCVITNRYVRQDQIKSSFISGNMFIKYT